MEKTLDQIPVNSKFKFAGSTSVYEKIGMAKRPIVKCIHHTSESIVKTGEVLTLPRKTLVEMLESANN